MKAKIFFPNLDGLRFFCFLAVFLFHSFHSVYDHILNDPFYKFIKYDLFGNGNLGVNFFFVLSGFLITYLLLVEKSLSEKINIPNFYIRRILRIWPLFFFCVAFGFIVFPFIKKIAGEVPNEAADPVYYLFFLNNFDFIKNRPDSSVLGVLWSVAVEEQFYLFWPLILAFLSTRFIPFVFVIIIIQSVVFRFLNFDALIMEYHTLSCINDMAIGGLGAYAVFTSPALIKWIQNLHKNWIILSYCILLFVLLTRSELLQATAVSAAFERVLVAFLFLFIILEQNYANHSLFKLSDFKWITYLGKRTYGLYCLHFIGILTVTQITKMLGINTALWQVLIIDTVFSLLTTLLIAEISYRFYETPFLKLKERFSLVTQH